MDASSRRSLDRLAWPCVLPRGSSHRVRYPPHLAVRRSKAKYARPTARRASHFTARPISERWTLMRRLHADAPSVHCRGVMNYYSRAETKARSCMRYGRSTNSLPVKTVPYCPQDMMDDGASQCAISLPTHHHCRACPLPRHPRLHRPPHRPLPRHHHPHLPYPRHRSRRLRAPRVRSRLGTILSS